MTDNATPKPCPKCGGIMIIFCSDDGVNTYYRCFDCGFKGPEVYPFPKRRGGILENNLYRWEEALRRWNERAGEEAQP